MARLLRFAAPRSADSSARPKLSRFRGPLRPEVMGCCTKVDGDESAAASRMLSKVATALEPVPTAGLENFREARGSFRLPPSRGAFPPVGAPFGGRTWPEAGALPSLRG